jgi:nucleoside-diphosphate-sugar epimerase
MALYFITGVNGFIGSHAAKRVIREGHRVRGLVRQTSDLALLEGVDIELVYGDVTRPETLQNVLAGVDKIIHTAGIASDWGAYNDFYRVNYEGTLNTARAADEAGVKRFVHIATTAVHGFGFKGISEDHPKGVKLNAYATTKRMAEEWLFEFSHTSSMEVTVLRPGNVYGPDDHTFIDKYLDALYTGKIAYVNKGRALTCPVYIDNVIDGIWSASHAEAAVGQAFFLTDGLDITWREFTEKLAEALGVKKPVLSIPYGVGYAAALVVEGIYRLFRIKRAPVITRYRVGNGGLDYHFSIEKARRFLNYNPAVPLDEAVRRTAEWYLNRPVR